MLVKIFFVVFLTLILQVSKYANELNNFNDGPHIEISDSLLGFGIVYTDTFGVASLTISNIGNDLLNIDSIVTRSLYFKTNLNHLTIIPDGNKIIQVTFLPTEQKLYNEELLIYSNDLIRSPQKIYLFGNGKIKQPQIYISKNDLSFGLVEINKIKTEQFYIKNVGLADLVLNDIFLEVTKSPFYFTKPDSIISPNDSVFVKVFYKYNSEVRQIENTFTNKIIIHSNTQFNSSLEVNLNGTTNRKFYVPSYYTKIQNGIDSTWYNDTLIVSPGRYFENLQIWNRNIVIASEYLFNKDTSIISNTIIDGNSAGNAVYFNGSSELIEFMGFTIVKGEAEKGGGIFIDYRSKCKLSNLIVSNNKANFGAGIYSESSKAEILNVTISYNDGGGIELNGQNIKFKDFKITNNINGSGLSNSASNCTISDGQIRNNSAFAGGGISAQGSSQIYKNIIIAENSALDIGGGIANFGEDNIFDGLKVVNNKTLTDQTGWGGGIQCQESSPIIQNCLIEGNFGYSGGGIAAFFGNPVIINSTIVNNIDRTYSSKYLVGGGLYCVTNANPIIINSIFWDNTTPEINFHMVMDEDIISIANSIIKGGFDSVFTYNGRGTVEWLGGNLNLDPLFVDELNKDFRLKETSPAIGAGVDTIQINEQWYYSPFTDLMNNNRPNPYGSKPDIGAYENEFGTISIVEKNLLNLPAEYKLYQNYPNPFNPNTTINFTVIKQENVALNVYNILGKRIYCILNDEISPGSYSINFNAENLPSGVYYYRIETASFTETKKLLLLK